jgi:hypothetical protein
MELISKLHCQFVVVNSVTICSTVPQPLRYEWPTNTSASETLCIGRKTYELSFSLFPFQYSLFFLRIRATVRAETDTDREMLENSIVYSEHLCLARSRLQTAGYVGRDEY